MKTIPLIFNQRRQRLEQGTAASAAATTEEEPFCVIFHPHRDAEYFTRTQLDRAPYFGRIGRLKEKLKRQYRNFGILRHEIDPITGYHLISFANRGGIRWIL